MTGGEIGEVSVVRAVAALQSGGAALGRVHSPRVQGYLAHKKTHPPGTLPLACAKGPREVLGGWVFSYERVTPV